MKILLAITLLIGSLASARAATTINASNKFSYGANFGWMDWRGDTNNGAVIGQYVCSGYIYAANVGWIHLGSGAPTNGVQYQNLAASDFGVNHDGLGNLRGYAYGANIGWINFETNGAPKVDLVNGKLSGSVYSANCGWISLSNAVAQVKTDTIAPGLDSDGDGLADAWERQNFGNLGQSAGGDSDGDGASNLNEYLAGTNPNDPSDFLRITYIARGDVMPDFTTLRWTSKPTHYYTIQARPTLDISTSWVDSIGYGFGASNSTFSTGTTNNLEFYRIKAYRPLGP
jgi:hypothetical protein